MMSLLGVSRAMELFKDIEEKKEQVSSLAPSNSVKWRKNRKKRLQIYQIFQPIDGLKGWYLFWYVMSMFTPSVMNLHQSFNGSEWQRLMY